MNNICTTPEQSASLIKAGIPINTADMYYRDGVYHIGKPDMNSMAVVCPCWSLKALIDSLPPFSGDDVYVWHLIKNANAYNDIKEPFYMCEIIRNADKKHGWWCEFGKDEFDAIVRLVCLLDAMGTGIIKKGGAS